ncbi:MAG: 30S ribosomal protein S6 [Thermodesulfobacteriota bacterium]
MERDYETVWITKPDLGEEGNKGIIGKATALVEGAERETEVAEWGRRKLAYPIQKNPDGYYVLMTYTSTPEATKELERMLRLNEDVLRYQTVGITRPEPEPEAAPAEVSAEAPAEAPAETSAAAPEAVEAPAASSESTEEGKEGGRDEK